MGGEGIPFAFFCGRKHGRKNAANLYRHGRLYSGSHWHRPVLYLSLIHICRLLSLGLDMGVLWLGIEILHMNDMLVKILSNILVIIVNYIASKFFIFKKRRPKPEMEKKSGYDAE